MSTLHHLPPAPALSRLAAALRPGGVLAAVALPRTDLPREAPLELAAIVHHHAMPVLDPVLTTRQVHRIVTGVLPGARVRRLLLWRYLLVWHKPHDA